MPRDSNGNYALPSGNPVVTGTAVSSSWANVTMADIANELTNSLSRTGAGGMLAPFKFADGTVSAPAVAFNSEPSTGVYRNGAGTLSIAIQGVNVAQCTFSGLSSNALSVTGTIAPTVGIYQPAANQLGFATAGVVAGYFDAAQNLNLTHALSIAQGGTGATSAGQTLQNLGVPAWTSNPTVGDLVQYGSNGNLFANLLHTGNAGAENPLVGNICVMNTAADGFHRWAAIDNVLRQLMTSSAVTVQADPGTTPAGLPGALFYYY